MHGTLFDQRQVVRLVEWGEAFQATQIVQTGVIQPLCLCVAQAAVHNTVCDGADLPVAGAVQAVQQRGECGALPVRPGDFGQGLSAYWLVADLPAELRGVGQAADLAACQTRPLWVEQRALEAG